MNSNELKSAGDISEEQKEIWFLTPEEVRSFPKYKNATDEEVWNVIHSLHRLALVCYEAFVKEEKSQANSNEVFE